MELPTSSDSGSGDCAPEMAETLQFREEIRSLMAEADLHRQAFDSPPENGSSFTALLELPTNQALELLHEPESLPCPPIGSWRDPPNQVPFSSFNCSPAFPSNAALVDRAARFSIFAEESSAAAAAAAAQAHTSADPSNASEISSVKLKIEPADSDPSPNFSSSPAMQRSGKRKGAGNDKKVKATAKRSRNAEDGSSKTGEESKASEKLPYVHVRARRGQATDSHSLAERARREKINARMKLLQELVPGCSKISGTALVLDEIINHVQSLQRQVEFLSMRLAAVNPRIDFSSLNSLFTTDNGDLATSNVASMVAMDPLLWSQLLVNGSSRHQQKLWHSDLRRSWQRDDSHTFITPECTLLDFNTTNSVA